MLRTSTAAALAMVAFALASPPAPAHALVPAAGAPAPRHDPETGRDAGAGAPAGPDDALGRGTPRGAVEGFLAAVGAGEYERAAGYLQGVGPRGRSLARQLGVVLDRAVELPAARKA